MKTLHMKCVFVVTGFCLIIVSAAAQNVSVVRIEPDPLQQLPCPQQKIEFRCQIMVPSFAVEWTLPTDETLEFGQAENIGAVYVSSDNTYSATLTDRTGDPNSNNRFFFTSTLLVLVPVNGSNLTCVGLSGAVAVKESTSIIISGNPDPPHDLSYDDRVVIESSVDLQWTRPSYTGGGGVAVMKYSVSANGMRLEVANSSRIVSYTTSHLVYGEVQVSAINTCGQESQPAAIKIPAKAPPNISDVSVEFSCDVNLKISAPVTIEWMYGVVEEGVVYPGDVEVVLKLNNGPIICSDVTDANISCTVTLPRDVYNISITQSNDIGSTVDSASFDMAVLVVSEQISLILNTQLLFIVTVRRNGLCPETKSPVLVTFGTIRKVAGGECEIQQKSSEMTISSGDSASFYGDAAPITLGPDETICFIVSLDGVPVISGTSSRNASTAITISGSSDQSIVSVDAVAGIAVALSLLVVLPVGVVFGCCGMWCLMKSQGRKKRRMAPPLYEEPVKPVFSLTENQAYGQVARRQTTS